MTIITDETIVNRAKTFIKTFEQIEKIAQTDGTKAAALELIREVYPDYEWHNLNTLLFGLQLSGCLSGMTFEKGQIVEPIRPVITDDGRKEIETKKKVVTEYE